MSQPNPVHKSQEQINKAKGNTAGRDFVFAPQQIYIETQIVEISTEKVTQKELIKSSPYKGLKRFNQSDRAYFFGRDEAIAKLFNAVNKSSLTLVLGASGSGKSSLVRAGLIPEFKKSLETGELYDFVFTPDQNPFESLYRCLLSEEKDYNFREAEAKIALEAKTKTIPQIIDTLKQNEEKWFLFVDQFEQLFTICTDSEKRQNFIKGIVEVAEKKDNSVRIVLAMRSDFLEKLNPYPELGAIANQDNLHLVTQMYPDELRQAIEQPAAKHGVVFEPGLVEQIIKEVEGQSGYLPLLQHTLDLLWQKECTTKSTDGRLCIENRVLNKTSYAALGGVRGSLQNYVDDVYQRICQENEKGELITKQIFLKLVNIVESDSGSRAVSRRAYRNEFVGDTVKDILQWLIDRNLLVSNYKYSSKEEPLSLANTTYKHNATVEIAHEILLSSWDKLKRWLEEEKEAIILKNWLADETRRWLEARSKDKAQASDELLRGSRLEQIIEFQQENAFEKLGGLSQPEEKYINTSLKQRDREKRRLQWTIGGLTFGLVAISIFAGIAIKQSYQSRINEIDALSNSSEAFSTSNQELDALIAGIKAGRKIQDNIFQVDTEIKFKLIGRLQNIFYRIEEINRLEGHQEDIGNVIFSPDGQTIATTTENYSIDKSGDNDNTLKLWNLEGKLINTLEHETGFKYIVFSPDSQIIAAITHSNIIKLWNREGKLLHTFEANVDDVSKIVFSPDSKSILSFVGYKDGKTELWNMKGELLSSFEYTHDVLFSPDGNIIASRGTYDNTIKLWNFEGKLLETIYKTDVDVDDELIFSPDGQIIASASQDNSIRLWNIQGELLHILKGHTGKVYETLFSPDGKNIIFIGANRDETNYEIGQWNLQGKLLNLLNVESLGNIALTPVGQTIITFDRRNSNIKMWDFQGKLLYTLPNHIGGVNEVIFSPDGQTIAAISNDATVKLWNMEGELLHSFFLNGYASRDWSIEFSPNSKTIASTGHGNSVKLWNLERELLYSLNGHGGGVNRVVFSPNRQIVASENDDSTVKLWNTKGKLIHVFNGHGKKNNVKSVVFSPDSKTIASIGWDKKIRLWNMEGEFIHSFSNSEDNFNSIVFSPNGKIIATGGENKIVKLWDLQGKLIDSLEDHNDAVNTITFSPNGKFIASGSEDKMVKLWNIEGKLLHTLEGHQYGISELVFSPDGQIVASVDGGYSAKLWNIEGKLIHSFEPSNSDISNLTFSPNGQMIAANSGDTNLSLLNLEGELLHTLQGHTDDIIKIAFSSDSKFIVSASWDRTVKLWNLEGELIHSFNGHEDWIQGMALSQDRNKQIIASASNDETIKLWSLDLDEVLDRGCDWARDYLTNNPNVSEEDRKLCNTTKSTNSSQFH